jgi:hypothetical protein
VAGLKFNRGNRSTAGTVLWFTMALKDFEHEKRKERIKPLKNMGISKDYGYIQGRLERLMG